MSPGQRARNKPGHTVTHLTTETLPPAVCIGSNDDVWAGLLAQNLTARGIETVRCTVGNLKSWMESVAEGTWIVLDGGWPMMELQCAVEDLNPLLRQPHINTVVVVDELVGRYPLSGLEPDTFISRSSDMRVFVRELLELFHSFIPGRPPAPPSRSWTPAS